LTVVWYASSSDYADALRFNGVMFAIACFAGQWLLRDHYRLLVESDHRHRWMFWLWLLLYIFVAIQMAWVLRPFVGAPGAPVEFLRREKWGNAYLVVARLIYEAMVR
jgi:di/tricarboxylate transporter